MEKPLLSPEWERPLEVSTSPSAGVTTQQDLFPRVARWVVQFQDPAESLGRCEADDGHGYFLKGDYGSIASRANEWLGNSIAERVGIGCPTFTPVIGSDAQALFGSRVIAGVDDDFRTAQFLNTASKTELGHSRIGLTPVLSQIYALDLFINNDDRHVRNYLSYDDHGRRRIFAFDFGRSMFWRWPWDGFPAVDSNTRFVGRVMRSRHGWDFAEADRTLDLIEKIDSTWLGNTLDKMPPEWLSETRRNQLVSFIENGDWGRRIEQLRRGLSDESLL